MKRAQHACACSAHAFLHSNIDSRSDCECCRKAQAKRVGALYICAQSATSGARLWFIFFCVLNVLLVTLRCQCTQHVLDSIRHV